VLRFLASVSAARFQTENRATEKLNNGTAKKLLTVEALVPALNEALSLNLNVRSIASMRLAHKIPYHKIGYRTVRYDFDKVFAALTRVL
jgi:hypothetical protein